MQKREGVTDMGRDARGSADSERMKTGQRVQCWKREKEREGGPERHVIPL